MKTEDWVSGDRTPEKRDHEVLIAEFSVLFFVER
jgi:hypothetical protein